MISAWCFHACVHRKTSLDVGSPAGEDEEVEGLLHNAEGCVIFTGGHYSAGPDYIGGWGGCMRVCHFCEGPWWAGLLELQQVA
jgi:hypothetical protein